MVRTVIAIALFTLISGDSFAGGIIDLDHACFRANDSLAYVEVYASVQRSHLIYQKTADSLKASFMLELNVLQDTTTVIADTFAATDAVSREDSATSGQFFPHVFRFIMKPGIYPLRADLIQDSTRRGDVTLDTVTVRLLHEDSLMLSDIEFGCSMSESAQTSSFAKNGVFMLPNPTRFYGTNLPLLYYYAEAYGLNFDSARADSYSVTYRIWRAEDSQLARPETRRVHPTAGSSVVIAEGFPVSTLRTGTYELEVEVSDLRSGQSTATRKKFWTYRKDDFLAGRMLEPSPEYSARLLESAPNALDVMDPDSALRLMKYALTSEQAKRADRLNSEGKHEFVRSFWAAREKEDPGAANRYFARIAEADARWNYLRKPGWKTDRGRVYVLYGEPDLIDRNYADPAMTDNETWHYDHLEGGVIFVFADTKGFGDLELVHSTKRGEISNPNWYVTEPSSAPREGFR